jgi:hypothetical protein
MPLVQNITFSLLLFAALECLFSWKIRRMRRTFSQAASR